MLAEEKKRKEMNFIFIQYVVEKVNIQWQRKYWKKNI